MFVESIYVDLGAVGGVAMRVFQRGNLTRTPFSVLREACHVANKITTEFTGVCMQGAVGCVAMPVF